MITRFNYLIYFFVTVVLIVSCQQKKKEMIEADPTEVTTSDSSAVVPQPDSLKADPQLHETAMQQDPPPAPAVKKTCTPNFNALKSPVKNHYFFYVSDFNPGEFICWEEIQKHGVRICGGNPCTIFYLDNANAAVTSTAPLYMDANTLAKYGIGKFQHTGRSWDIQGARIWNRKEKGYSYYYINNL